MFAIAAGAVAFIGTLVAVSAGRADAQTAGAALIVAIACAVLCWAVIERSIASIAGAVDAAIARLARAAEGDLASPIPDQVGRHVPALATAMSDLFQQLHANFENVQQLALFDPVTGLPNRTNFRRCCEDLIARAAPGTACALFFIDLDRFKKVNDTLGHAMGDVLLSMVADRLRRVAQRFALADATPVVGRLAGDEFTLFFPRLHAPSDADRIGQELLAILSEAFDLGGQSITVGASVGIAIGPDHGSSLNTLLRAADAAMYHAKGLGRGRVECFTEHLASEIAGRVRLEAELHEALEKDQFALVFQPQVRAADRRIVGAEALLRWRHPQSGIRMPASFIERAEECGLIVEIGDWVIGEIAATIVRWSRTGVRQRVSINISQRQLDHASFFRRLREQLHLASAPASLLELEISETRAMYCSDDVVEAIAALRADGATVAIDDFGTGYTNLARLRNLPVDRVKLHRSLTEHVAERAEARAIAQAVVHLIHGLNCEVVAVGIESDAQAEVLRIIGCDVLQGYAVALPMVEGDFLNWCAEEHRRAKRLAG